MSRKNPPDQLPLVMPEEERPPQPRSKRLRVPEARPEARPAPPVKPAEASEALMQHPVRARCGFCGAALTVMGDAALCPECGGIVARPTSDLDS